MRNEGTLYVVSHWLVHTQNDPCVDAHAQRGINVDTSCRLHLSRKYMTMVLHNIIFGAKIYVNSFYSVQYSDAFMCRSIWVKIASGNDLSPTAH